MELLYRASFLCLGNASCLDYFQRFILWAFNVVKCIRVPLMWHSPGHPQPFCHNHSLHSSLYSVSSSGCKSRVSGKMTSVSIFTIAYFFYNTIYIPFKFHFTSIFFIFSFAALSSLLTDPLFQLPIFIQCCVGLSLGEKEATQLHTLLSLPKLYSRWAVTNHWQTLKQLLGLLTDGDAQVIYIVICGLRSYHGSLYSTHFLTVNMLW